MYSLKVSSFQKNMTALHFIIEFPSAKAVIFMAASAATTATFVRSVARDFLTSELTHYASSKLAQFLSIFSSLLFQTAILRHLLHPHWLHIMYSTKSRKDPLKNLCLSLALSLICIFSLKKVSSFPKNMTSLHFKIEFPSAKAVISMAASAAATAMFVRSTARDFLPSELTHYASSKLAQFLSTFSSEATLLIDEYEGLNKNRLFYAAELYAGTIVSPSTRRYRASLLDKEKNISISLGGPDEIADKFAGIHLKWRLITKEIKPRYVNNLDDYQSTMISETRYLQLTFHKKHKNKVIDEYLPYVLERSEAVKENKKSLKLYTLKNDRVHGPRIHPWQSVNLDHPAKFETLAMDDETKETIVGDLDIFLKRKELYRKVGKAWKRGYLLFGPPGTGKSSLIAAMANYLNFDVYDLELTDIRSNSELRKLLITTANRSILVVEDIDASIDLTERKKNQAPKPPPPHPMYPYQQQGPKVTLSGLLNFIDGLWSSIGDERIIIFTTNHKEKLDPALLRLGRMDVHIHMSYCTPCGFKLLAKNYLGVTEHPLVFKAEEMMASSKVTPAEVGEQLLKSEDPELALNGLIKFLESKKVEERERKEKSEESDDAAEEIEDVTNNKKLKKSKSNNGLKELMKIAKSSSPAENGRIIRKDEAANALKTLFGFLEQETRDGETSNRDSSLATLGATALQESAKANGIRG